MGGVTAPVAGSMRRPACTAWVSILIRILYPDGARNLFRPEASKYARVIMLSRVTPRFCCLLALGAAMLAAAAPDLAQARKLYRHTDYDGSLKVLLPISPKDGATYLLIGQNY